MTPLALDFSPYRARRRRLLGLLTLGVAALLLAAALLQQRTLQARIAELDAAAAAAVPAQVAVTPSESELQDGRAALAAQRALNLPWQDLLAALEQAQDDKVLLLALQPNPQRQEVVLSGEAASFAALMHYLKALRAQPVFADVALVNQRQVEQEEGSRLAFTLAADWRAGAP